MPNALDTYLSAVQKFQQCAAPIMENLVKAREAYEEALRASAEIRQILSSQDDSLGSVMTKLQDTVSVHLVRKNDPTKLIEISPADESGDALARQIQETEPNPKLADKKTETAAPKKRMWNV